MTELEREQRAELLREKRHGTKKVFMGALMAVLVAGGAYILLTSHSSEPEQLAQQEVTMPAFTPSAIPSPTALPPVPLPDATPMPKASAPAKAAERAAPTPMQAPAVTPLEEMPIPQAPAIDPLPSSPTP